MTGLEMIKEEIIRRGGTKQQAESKVVAIVLDIVANGDKRTYQSTIEEEEKLENIRFYQREAEFSKNRAIKEKHKIEEEISQLREVRLGLLNDREKYISDFLETLKKCETEEARDAMRAAQVFINSVQIKTASDNTAFIKGIGEILAGKKIGYVRAIVEKERPSRKEATLY